MMASRMGFRFRPSNEELVDPYLKKKIYDRDFSVPRIQELDISKIEPWDLPQQYPNPPKDNVWYFYCLPSRYGHSKHTSRKTTAGSWKITARDRIIKARNGSRKVIGVKKTLTFYERRKDSGRGKKATKPIKTNWVMNEFHYLDIPPGKKPYVICRIKIKQDDKHNSTNKVSSSQLLASNVRSEVSANPILELGPSLISQSEIFNEVSGTDHDFSSVNQSSVHPQQESVNYMLTDNTSPDEGQSRCHHLASNYEDDGLELEFPLPEKPYVICHIKIKQDDKHNSTNKVSSSQLLASNIRSEVSANPILELGPSLISQSEIFNEVSETDHDFSSVNQSSVHPQQESVNYMLTDNTSPDEGQSRCHQLASNYEDDGLELKFPLPEMDPHQLAERSSLFYPPPKSSMDNYPSNCDNGQPNHNLLLDYGHHAIENTGQKVDAWRHEEFGAYNNYNGLGHNYFVTKQPPIHSELGPLNTQGFIVHGKSNSPFGNQIELGDDLTNSLWASQNSNYVCQEPIGTGPPNINLLYSANGVRIGGDYSEEPIGTGPPNINLLYSANGVRIGGDYSDTDTETTNPWVKDYSAQNDGEYYSYNPQPVSIWDCGYFY